MHRGAARVLAGGLSLLVAAGSAVFMAPAASAAISSAGPLDPANLFPSYYADANGLQLQMCQDGLPNCLAGPDQMQDVHAAGGDAEAFYFHASVENVGGFLVETALEAAYLGDGPDQEVTFQRRQAGAKGVTPNGKYTITDPYGTYECTADGTGLVQPAKGCRFETTPIPGNFNAALGGPNGPIGPFLTWDTFGSTGAGAPPAGFIGDNATPHTVVGSPNGFNKMRVSGPGIVGTCTNDDGSTVDNCQETDKIVLQGKVQPGGATAALSAGTLDYGDVPGTPPVKKTLTYANTGSVPVTVNSAAVTGTGAAAFAVTNNCPVAPATVDVGTRCTIDVTFTPEAGKASAATLTVTDDTAVATRNVALKGSNLGVMYVADPAPPASLVFPSTAAGSTSLQDNVVLGNSGNGPLTIASAILTGASAAQYKLGPNNTCQTPVAPDAGCEIGVQFAPTSSGSKTANLRVTDSNGKIVNVPITGSATVQALPSAPTIGTATAGNGTATVNWTAPTTTGTSAITGYTLQVFDGATQVGADRLLGNVTTSTVTGLTNGTAYTFKVAATNSSGTGAFSANSNAVTPAGAPAAPAVPTATAGNAQATVNWTAPADNGSAITSYDVEVRSGTTVVRTVTGIAPTATSTVVGTLTNGTAYTFRVRAVNGIGTGAFSPASTAVTPAAPATAPAAPAAPTATPGNAQATVNWTAPANGGSAITGYTLQVFDGATQVGADRPLGNVTTTTVTGLTNGTAYTFKVAAINAVGTGAFSPASAAVTPVAPPANTAPGAPTIGTATATSGSATVTWTAPANNGGSAITGYTVRTYAGTSTTPLATTTPAGATATSVVVNGLTNGTSYTFDVIATNAVGNSQPSAKSNAVTPAATVTAPGAPGSVTATPGNAQATVNWTAPATGGAPTGYTLRVFSGTTQVGADRLLGNVTTSTVTGLTNGTAYTFRVAATNTAGASTFTSSAAVTPTATAAPTPAGISFVAQATTAADNLTTFSVAKPAGTAANDTLIAVVASRGTPVVNTPAGWTKVRSELNGTAITQYVFSKVATATEPASYSFTLSKAGTGTVAAVSAYRGVATVGGVVASAGLNTAATVSSVSAPAAASVANGRVINLYSVAKTATFTAPAGNTERSDVTTGTAASFKASLEITDGATTGTSAAARSATATGTASVAAIGQTVTLKPAG